MRRALRFGVGAVVSAVVVLMATGVAGASPSVAQQLFRNCDEARAAGQTDIAQGQPGYSPELDRDGDGVACESDDPAAAPATPAPAPDQNAQVPPEVQGATQDALATTGVSMLTPVLLLAALVLMIGGHRLIEASYERLKWLPGRRHREVRFTVERVRGGRRRR